MKTKEKEQEKEPKKKNKVGMWIGIGCGGLFFIGLISLIIGACSSAIKNINDTTKQPTASLNNTITKSEEEITKLEETTEPKEETKSDEENKIEKSTSDLPPKYPSLTEETMDKDLILNCVGGDEVVLWDKPTDAAGGAKFKYRVPCGTIAWAFNKYYNEQLKVTFYAVNTNDSRVKNSYGWVTEDLITWE